MTLGEIPFLTASRRGRKTAIWFKDQTLSFDALANRVASLTRLLRENGLETGQRVAIHMDNSPEYLAAYFAVPACGGVVVPLNTFLAPAEVASILADAAPSMLLADRTAIKRLLCEPLDTLAGLKIISHEDLKAAGTHSRGQAPPVFAPADHLCDADPAVMLYTSGTTGIPKGVVLSHRALIANARACGEAVGVTTSDRVLLALPMFHSFAQMVGMLTPVLHGMGIVLCEKLDRGEVRRAITSHRPTIMPAVPAVFAAMANTRIGLIQRWLNPLRLYISGGAPLQSETLRAFERNFRRPLCEGYGLSEAGPVVSLNPPSGPRKPGSVGPPIPGVQVRIVDGEGVDVTVGSTGELLVLSPALMERYEGLPAESAAVLRGGWLRTGDLARCDGDGYLFIMGRIKEMLIFRGMNVYPREIECVIETLPGVRDVAVIGLPDPVRGEVPCAFVVPADGCHLDEAELRRACAQRLARYKIPRHIRVVAALPRNAAGKVVKSELVTTMTRAHNSGRAVAG